MADLARTSARIIIESLALQHAHPVIAYDYVEAGAKGIGKDKHFQLKRHKDGDKSLFQAVDSALRAARYWHGYEINTPSSGMRAFINVPICVLAEPFWAIPLDDGKVGIPVKCDCAYQVVPMPSYQGLRHLLVLICAPSKIQDVARSLTSVFNWFKIKLLDGTSLATSTRRAL
jgi:hypothetical protein